MNKAFENIIERVEADVRHTFDGCINKRYVNRIVSEVAEEYNNGWVPCSEKLPSGLDFVLYTHKDGEVDICSIEYFYDYLDRFTAWQPLPEPYKE